MINKCINGGDKYVGSLIKSSIHGAFLGDETGSWRILTIFVLNDLISKYCSNSSPCEYPRYLSCRKFYKM